MCVCECCVCVLACSFKTSRFELKKSCKELRGGSRGVWCYCSSTDISTAACLTEAHADKANRQALGFRVFPLFHRQEQQSSSGFPFFFPLHLLPIVFPLLPTHHLLLFPNPSPNLLYHHFTLELSSTPPPLLWKQWNNSRLAVAAAWGCGISATLCSSPTSHREVSGTSAKSMNKECESISSTAKQ